MEKLEELMKEIDNFNKERDWDKFHSPENLSKSISIEAAELLECFQWDSDNFDLGAVKEELADVIIYCLQLSSRLHVDPVDICKEKMKTNAEKYPKEKAKGNAIKYDKL